MLNRIILPWIAFLFYRTLSWTWRIEVHYSPYVQKALDNGEPFVLAHWHGDELGILHQLKPLHASAIISTSKDGDIMDKVVRLLGGETTRGSSTRGGTQALKGIIATAKKGRRPSVAVDGPKGPIYQVKPGVLQISRLTQLPIVPITFAATRFYVFEKAWNKSQLPLPFSRLVLRLGEEMPAITKTQDPKDERLLAALKKKLDENKVLATKRRDEL